MLISELNWLLTGGKNYRIRLVLIIVFTLLEAITFFLLDNFPDVGKDLLEYFFSNFCCFSSPLLIILIVFNYNIVIKMILYLKSFYQN